MKVTVEAGRLVQELKVVAGAAEKSATIPILMNVLLEAEGDWLRLTATNLDLFISSVCPAAVKQAGSITLPAHRLRDYVGSLGSQDLYMESTKNDSVSLVSGRSKARIAGMSREAFPQEPLAPEGGLEISAGAWQAMIARTGFAISQEETRFTLDAVQLEVSPTGARMVATDGHRLAYVERADVAAVTDLNRVLIPRKVLDALVKLMALEPDGSVLMSHDANHLFFGVGGRKLFGRKLTGSFPDYARVLPGEAPVRLTMDREDLLTALTAGPVVCR